MEAEKLDAQLILHEPKPGKVTWIGIRPLKRRSLLAVETVVGSPQNGLHGDHYEGKSGNRQVTLIQQEHLAAVAHYLGKEVVEPSQTRRNLVIEGINLLSLRERKLLVGKEVILEITGFCPPCKQMETSLGYGGYHAMVGHGGLTARILRGGTIHIGDKVTALD